MDPGSRTAFTCPHCGVQAISWLAKKACAMERVPCRCHYCNQVSREAHAPRLIYSGLQCAYFLLLGTAGASLVQLVSAPQAWLLFVSVPALILAWYLGDSALLKSSYARVPLVALNPQARWQRIKDAVAAGLIVTLLVLMAATLLLKMVHWVAGLLPP